MHFTNSVTAIIVVTLFVQLARIRISYLVIMFGQDIEDFLQTFVFEGLYFLLDFC